MKPGQFPLELSLVFVCLVPLAIAGVSLLNTGLGRSRSAAQAMTASLCVVSVAVLVYFVCGFAISVGVALGPPPFFFRGIESSGLLLPALFASFGAALAAVIPLGSAADRWRLGAACASTALLAGITYALWVNGTALGPYASAREFPLRGVFLDGGTASIQVTGGLTALAICWLLGPRHGKYSSTGLPAAIPAHNAVLVLFGCMLAWIGWLGLNLAGAILFSAIPVQATVLVVINITFSAAASALTAAVITRYRFRKPDASLIANGWMAGLVASSAGCAVFKAAIAILVGLVAGALVVFSVEFLEFTLKVDDPCGSVSVHAVAGIWGLLAAGIFAGGAGHFMVQIVGIATLIGFILPLAYGLNWLLGWFIPHRVSPDGERQGLDLHELGADAYPEFVVHADEFMQ